MGLVCEKSVGNTLTEKNGNQVSYRSQTICGEPDMALSQREEREGESRVLGIGHAISNMALRTRRTNSHAGA